MGDYDANRLATKSAAERAAPAFAESFTSPALVGETITLQVDDFTVTATIHDDDDMGAPWVEHDGHGEVSDWRGKDSKRPGELVLITDDRDRSARFYDFAGAVQIARRDGWGAQGDEGMTPRQKAAHAARSDFEYLRRWCNDEWRWVGVAVTVQREGVDLTGPYDHALWGIDSESADHLTETASDLIGDALDAARAKIQALTSGVES